MTYNFAQDERECAARLRAALDKPLPKAWDDDGDEVFCPWVDILDGIIAPYNSEIDRVAIEVLEAIGGRTNFDLLDGPDGLAAEIIMHMLSVWLCDYGSSPRGCFPLIRDRSMWVELIDKWKAYAEVRWTDPDDE